MIVEYVLYVVTASDVRAHKENDDSSSKRAKVEHH
jgi:hypothetical protein